MVRPASRRVASWRIGPASSSIFAARRVSGRPPIERPRLRNRGRVSSASGRARGRPSCRSQACISPHHRHGRVHSYCRGADRRAHRRMRPIRPPSHRAAYPPIRNSRRFASGSACAGPIAFSRLSFAAPPSIGLGPVALVRRRVPEIAYPHERHIVRIVLAVRAAFAVVERHAHDRDDVVAVELPIRVLKAVPLRIRALQQHAFDAPVTQVGRRRQRERVSHALEIRAAVGVRHRIRERPVAARAGIEADRELLAAAGKIDEVVRGIER
ncbi:hypothetical protein BMA2284.1 [Burkholderia mallei ATCC 23344]|uniref:Uncharacterized protein n=1 Tax=Burkholderia mallei (strain ATCC 23344) TaxID=243160 RepID=A0A0H2WKL7_BURMA|nr:hypothetical protein BMA2284.1 [Burkholderia mallei ATCC 23344]